ncbi:MAG: hypothetical protein JXR70_13950 [Spirochaetales bacterium]|nr:hypothetical protein [Spirochaetales bacterium]
MNTIAIAANQDFEKIQSQNTEVLCPECGSEKLTKKLSSFSFSQGSSRKPACQSNCGEAYQKGCCGSGLCPGGN